jgi:hypothetical protein
VFIFIIILGGGEHKYKVQNIFNVEACGLYCYNHCSLKSYLKSVE